MGVAALTDRTEVHRRREGKEWPMADINSAHGPKPYRHRSRQKRGAIGRQIVLNALAPSLQRNADVSSEWIAVAGKVAGFSAAHAICGEVQ